MVKSGTLTQTESASRYHSFQTYFHIRPQKEGSNLRAVGAVKSSKFIPVLTDFRGYNSTYSQNNEDVYVKLIVQVADAEAEKNCPGLMLVVFVKKH